MIKGTGNTEMLSLCQALILAGVTCCLQRTFIEKKLRFRTHMNQMKGTMLEFTLGSSTSDSSVLAYFLRCWGSNLKKYPVNYKLIT